MTSYEEERAELIAWIKEKQKEYDIAEKEETARYGLKRDSNAGYTFSLHWQEFLRKGKELKKKYNIPE